MPESKRHLLLRTLLFQVLHSLRDRGCIGCDQFVYYNANDPKRCVAPDAFLRLGAKDELFGSWKTWERGAPELCVEIASEGETESDWADKLVRYRELGVIELVWFDPAAKEKLRAWDRVAGDLVEREIRGASSPCRVLGLHWVIVDDPSSGPSLRLARDASGRDLVLTAEEAERVAREALERKVRELEEELAKQRK